VPDNPSLPRYIRITDISEQGKLTGALPVSVDEPNSSDYALEDQDMLLARTGASVGKSHLFRTRAGDRESVFAGYLIRIRCDHTLLLPTFLSAFLTSKEYWDWVRRVSVRTGQPGISASQYASLQVPVPPIPVQREISESIDAVDSLIDSLDSLIIKKRQILRGVLHQLMSGARRLPGWSQGWSEVEVGQLCSPRKNRIYPGIPSAAQFCVELEHIEGKTGQLIGATTAGAGLSMKTEFHSGDVLFGKLRAYLQKFWLADRSGACSTEIWALAPQSDLIDSRYLRQLVSTHRFIQAASTAYGTHMPRSEWNTVARLRFQIPTIPEQEAIAEILSGMDSDIAVLVLRRNKLTLVKQAMTQELLSGRTLLP
jgi:type I restriction enzyme S subunit